MRENILIGGLILLCALTSMYLAWEHHTFTTHVIRDLTAATGSCDVNGECRYDIAGRDLFYSLIPGIILIIVAMYIMLRVELVEEDITSEQKMEVVFNTLEEDESRVLRIIREEEGISQSTLKYRADVSKSKLSQILKTLEKKGFVTKEAKGKTNKLYLKKQP